MSKPTVVLGFDCETDVGSFYTTYKGLVEGTPKLVKLCDDEQIAATFFFTGVSAREYPEVVRAVVDSGQEVGAHSVFHETVGEPIFDVPGITPLLPEEIPHRLAVATEWVADASGYTPVSWRCPRLFGSNDVINALEGLGYLADASYPMYFFRDRLGPYHPSADDWTAEGSLSIVEIPNFCDMGMESHDEFGRDRDQWPLFRSESADALLGHIDSFLEYVDGKGVPPVLCFYFHPWEFVEQPEKMFVGEGWVIPDPFITKNCGGYALEQMGLLVKGLKARGAEFVNCREMAKRTA